MQLPWVATTILMRVSYHGLGKNLPFKCKYGKLATGAGRYRVRGGKVPPNPSRSAASERLDRFAPAPAATLPGWRNADATDGGDRRHASPNSRSAKLRRASGKGNRRTRICRNFWGAAGIDSAAHRGALAAAGQTLVVAPAGWHKPYPENNRQLFQEIVTRGGGYLSLVEPDKGAVSGHFFARNAVLVALAKATVVVQAPLRSGSRNAAHVARKLGRLLYVVPSAPWVETGAGCVLELKLGARPLGSVRDMLVGLVEIGVHGTRDPLQLELPMKLTCHESHRPGKAGNDFALIKTDALDVKQLSDIAPVIKALSQGCRSLDSICRHSGCNTPKVQSALLHLTLIGCIRMTSAGQIELVNN